VIAVLEQYDSLDLETCSGSAHAVLSTDEAEWRETITFSTL
jgi:hypothetical protein